MAVGIVLNVPISRAESILIKQYISETNKIHKE